MLNQRKENSQKTYPSTIVTLLLSIKNAYQIYRYDLAFVFLHTLVDHDD